MALLFFCLVLATACGKSATATDVSEPTTLPTQQPTQQPQPTPEPAKEWEPFVSKEIYDAYTLNNDVVGWLTVTGCEIDNRIFQSYNNSYYLRLDEEGNYNVWGCYFLDYINVNDGYTLSDKVNIIYGHALNDDPNNKKFSKLKRFKNSDFALQNSTITFDLLYDTTTWQVFSACNIPITIDYIDPNPYTEKYANTLNYMKKNSFVDFGVDVTTDDQILVLSSCTSNENVRFVVAAKLVQ